MKDLNRHCINCGSGPCGVDVHIAFIQENDTEFYYVKCQACGFKSRYHDTADHAIEEWNALLEEESNECKQKE